jgi:hypothetical protein
MTIDPKRVKFVLAPTLIAAMLIFAWRCGAAFTEFRAELNGNFARLESAVRDTRRDLTQQINDKTADRWTGTQMREWTYQLERANRSTGAVLAVPMIPNPARAPE